MKDLRNHINNAANQHTEFVDNDKLWAGIQHKMIAPKKKRRILPLFVWGLFIAIIGIALIWNTANAPKDEKITFSKESKLSNNDLSQSKKILATKKINTSLQNVHKGNTDNINIHDKESINNVTTKEIKQIVNKKESIQSSNSPRIEKTEQNLEILFAHNINPNINSTFPKSHFTNHKESSLNEIQLNPEPENFDNTIKRKLINIQTINFSLNPLISKRSKLQIIPAYTLPLAISSIDKKHFSILRSLTIYGQYSFGNKSIQGISDYASLRNDSEELLEQIRVGIESDLITVLDFTLYGGISYASINDRVTSTQSYFEDREIEYLKSISIIDDGTLIENYVIEDLPHLIQNRIKRYNSHRMISMPVGLRFGKNISNLHLSIGFGLDINYYLSNTHDILDPTGELTSYDVGGKWLNPTLHTGFSIDYPISDHWFINTNISYRTTKIENTFLNNTTQENYSLYGLDLGLKFKF